MRKRKGPESHENLERWLITYADLITLLLAFFIMMYTFSKSDAEKYREVTGHLRTIFTGGTDLVLQGGQAGASLLEDPLRAPLSGGEVKGMLEEQVRKVRGKDFFKNSVSVIKDERGVVIRVLDRALFDIGKSDLKEGAKEALDRIAPVIKAVDNAVRVEGHTDDTPIATAEFRSNWELSARRATEVVRYFIENHKIGPQRLSAVGYSEYHPLAPNDTPANRSRNRRIEIIVVRSLSDEEGLE